MNEKKNVLEITQREIDILRIMIEAQKEVLLGEKKRICIAPAIIRDGLLEKYPAIKVHHVVSSQENLEELGLIARIHDERNDVVKGRRFPLTFQFNEELFSCSEFKVIQKRKSGYKSGTNIKRKPAVGDRAKTIITRGKSLLEKKKSELTTLSRKNAALRKTLSLQEAQIVQLRDEVEVIADLLALREKNLNAWERSRKAKEK